jgi:hypothetical protein
VLWENPRGEVRNNDPRRRVGFNYRGGTAVEPVAHSSHNDRTEFIPGPFKDWLFLDDHGDEAPNYGGGKEDGKAGCYIGWDHELKPILDSV